MGWSNNNSAHVTTWGSLYILEESKKTFVSSEAVPMKAMRFFVPGSSADARRIRAKSLALQLHNLFTIAFGAELESGVTQKQAVNGMVAVMVVAEKAMLDLADVADESYTFKPVDLGQ